VPAGVGSKGLVKLSVEEFKRVMIHGVDWCIEKGYGWEHDKERIEEYGCIPGADPSKVSEKAISRGYPSLAHLAQGTTILRYRLLRLRKYLIKMWLKHSESSRTRSS